jgi:hypothetical protein
MKFSLVFDNSGDTLPFEVKYNHELFEFFVDKSNQKSQNSFVNHGVLHKEVDQKLAHLHWAITKTNEVLYDLIGINFSQHNDLENYLNQDFLNKTHCDWVLSQQHTVDINRLRFSNTPSQAKLGNRLHDVYPDDIRFPTIAPVLEKLGYIFPYEEVNIGVHRLENLFNIRTLLEFKSDIKWQVFDNPFVDSMVTNNDVVNFSFGYTYVGRQYYNKFRFFDTELKWKDHYNYEQLEFAFQLNLSRPETNPFSPEAITWAEQQGIKLVAEQIPIANIENLEENLLEYRKILYRNSRDRNKAKIILH